MWKKKSIPPRQELRMGKTGSQFEDTFLWEEILSHKDFSQPFVYDILPAKIYSRCWSKQTIKEQLNYRLSYFHARFYAGFSYAEMERLGEGDY